MQRPEVLAHVVSVGFAAIATPVGVAGGMLRLDQSAVGNGLLSVLYGLCLYLGMFVALFFAHEAWRCVMRLAFRDHDA